MKLPPVVHRLVPIEFAPPVEVSVDEADSPAVGWEYYQPDVLVTDVIARVLSPEPWFSRRASKRTVRSKT